MPWKLKNENVISMMVKTMRGESGWFPLKSGLWGFWALALLLFAPYLFSYTHTTGLVLILRYSLFSFLFGKLFNLFSYKPNAMTGVRTSESPHKCVSFFVWKSVDAWCDWLQRVVGTWIWSCWQSIRFIRRIELRRLTQHFLFAILFWVRKRIRWVVRMYVYPIGLLLWFNSILAYQPQYFVFYFIIFKYI